MEKNEKGNRSIKALFAWDAAGEATGRKMAQRYGQRADMEIMTYGQAERDGLLELGKGLQMTHVLYFLDEEKLLFLSLADEMGGFTVEMFVSDLIL